MNYEKYQTELAKKEFKSQVEKAKINLALIKNHLTGPLTDAHRARPDSWGHIGDVAALNEMLETALIYLRQLHELKNIPTTKKGN